MTGNFSMKCQKQKLALSTNTDVLSRIHCNFNGIFPSKTQF